VFKYFGEFITYLNVVDHEINIEVCFVHGHSEIARNHVDVKIVEMQVDFFEDHIDLELLGVA